MAVIFYEPIIKSRLAYHVLRCDGDDGGHTLLPHKLPEEFIVEVQWSLCCYVGVGHVVAVYERKQNRVLPAQRVHAEPAQVAWNGTEQNCLAFFQLIGEPFSAYLRRQRRRRCSPWTSASTSCALSTGGNAGWSGSGIFCLISFGIFARIRNSGWRAWS